MKKIILIQPKVGSWEFIQDTPMLPLALLHVSSYLAGEYNIRIIDQRIDNDWVLTLKQELNSDVLCVGITTMTGPQISYALKASKVVKEHSDCPVVWGGIHPSILPEQTVSHPYVDIVVSGEGEKVFRDLVHLLEKNESPVCIPGVWVKNNGKPQGSLPEVVSDMNEFFPTPYNLVRIEDYISYDREGRRKFPIQTSRGCPYRCIFCHQTGKYRKKWRALTADNVLEKIKLLKDSYSIEHFHILDDNFFVDMDRAHSILQGIVDASFNIKFTINGARITDILRMKEETIRLLAKGGCDELQIGLESGSQRMLDCMKKDTTVSQVFQANQRLRKYSIPRYYELISGFPGESEDDLKQTARVILELSKDDPNVFFAPIECLNPYPGTEAYDQARAWGMEIPGSLDEWSSYQWHKAQLPWLDKKRKKLLESFHLYPTFISHEIKTMNSVAGRVLFRVYRPWARFRVRKLYFGFPFEIFLFNILSKLKS